MLRPWMLEVLCNIKGKTAMVHEGFKEYRLVKATHCIWAYKYRRHQTLSPTANAFGMCRRSK